MLHDVILTKEKKCIMRWKDKLHLAHGKHIPNMAVTPLRHLNMANEQGSVLQGFAAVRVWFGFDQNQEVTPFISFYA